MPIHDKAFWAISFFLVGVLLASFINNWEQKILVAVLAAFLVALVLFILERQWLAILSLAIILGAGYYFIFDARQKDVSIAFGEKTVFSGLVTKVSYALEKQDLTVKLAEPYSGKIRITTNRYPERRYGDFINFEGVIKKPTDRSAPYFEKEGIFGTVSFPKIELVGSNQGSPLISALFKIKSFAESTFRRVLPPEKAAFLSGLTVGETAEFSKEFREKMSLTGTSHLVALSGYNISIIGKSVMLALGFFFARRKSFWFATLAIILFVIMTGAEASVVRAAIMGFLVLLADQVERLYSFRNSIAMAAFIMILFNPKILVWDIGFELSFAAVIGLMYLKPSLTKFFKVKPEGGFLNWRENFWTTISAQTAVLPILLHNFGLFSPISILTNVLILVLIPTTMFLGFLIVLAGTFSYYFAQTLGYLAGLLLGYELWIIDFFSKTAPTFKVEKFSILLSIIYYLIIFGFITYIRNRPQKPKP